MARLAEYMAEVAAMLGERASVHFVKIDPGSVQLIHDVQYEAYPKVESRAVAIRDGTAPAEAMKAYSALNRKLAEDNTSGTFGPYAEGTLGAKILEFPGIRTPKPVVIAPIEQPSIIDGQIIGVGGRNVITQVPILINTGDFVQPCLASRSMAKELRNFFLEEERRFHGHGQWVREETGRWKLGAFTITSHEPLDHRPLSVLVGELRAVPSLLSEGADPWGELMELRQDESDRH